MNNENSGLGQTAAAPSGEADGDQAKSRLAQRTAGHPKLSDMGVSLDERELLNRDLSSLLCSTLLLVIVPSIVVIGPKRRRCLSTLLITPPLPITLHASFLLLRVHLFTPTTQSHAAQTQTEPI